MKIALLLGSGISVPTGLPRMDDITKSMLFGEWHSYDGGFIRGTEPNKHYQQENLAPRVQSFLRILKDITCDYFASRTSHSPNYENLYSILAQLWDEKHKQIHNPIIQPFIKAIDDKVKHLYNPFNYPYREVTFDWLVCWSMRFIDYTLYTELNKKNDPVGLDLISKLAKDKRIKELDIFTLNNDLLVEKLLDQKGIEFEGKFAHEDENGDRVIDPSNEYKKEFNVRLFKLHGSINYWRKQNKDDKYIHCIFDGTKEEWDDDENKENFGHGRVPYMLKGTFNKLEEYYNPLNIEIHFLFREFLKEHEIIIESGYGWNDKGINMRIFEWLEYHPKNKIICLHKNFEENFGEKSHIDMRNSYQNLIDRKKLIPVKKYLQDIKNKDDVDDIFKLMEETRNIQSTKSQRGTMRFAPSE